MSINPKNRPQPTPTAPPAPTVPPVAVASPVIAVRPPSEANGYLDPDQTLINFAVRELGYSFERIIQEDPNRLLRSWGKVYRKAKTTAIGTTVLGAGAVLMGVLTGATPLLVVGVLVGGASGLLVKKHSAGVESCDIEHEVLDDCRPVLAFLAELERRGVNPSDLVSLYDRVIKRVSSNPGRFSSASILQKLFKDEVEQSGVLAQVTGLKTGLASVAPSQVMNPDRAAALPESQAVGNATRLGAVEVPTVEPEPKARLLQQLQEHAMQAESVKTAKNIATSIATDLQSMLIVGQPGAGKGMLVAHAIREVKRLHPDVQIWAIDPKGAESESWRWAPCDRYLPLKLNPFATTKEMIDAVRDCSDLIRAFVALGNVPKLLIFDESLAMKEKSPKWFNDCMKGFNAMCSMGRESRMYGWLVSQSPNADDFGISGAMRNVYRRVLVLSRSNLGLLDNGSTFFSGKPSDELLMQTGRVYYDSIDGRWAAVPQWSEATAPVKPVANPTPEPRPAGESRRLMLERSLQLEHSPTSTDDDETATELERMKAIYDYAKKKGGITKRSLQRGNLTQLRGLKSDDLEFYLEYMIHEGFLDQDEDIYHHQPNRAP